MRDCVTFLLNGRRVDVRGIDPTTTLLNWLRREARLAGSKEGCAEGDCGACTVVVGSLGNGGVAYRAINACIAFVPMLEGKLVITVEGVKGIGGSLHPCQQALVDCHGSQCGFCTPGFVMSLYALYLDGDGAAVPSRAGIDDRLAGNLCRCTGYGPIIEAARRMIDMQRPTWDIARRAGDAALLAAIRHDATVLIEGAGRAMFVPASEDELARLAQAHPAAPIVAGATDAGLWVTKRDRDLPVLIHAGRIDAPPFRGVAVTPAGPTRRVWIGAGTTHSEAATALGTALPELGELWRRFAGAQVRNAGTVGGNLANGSPVGDLAPALMALDATLHLRLGDDRRTLPLADFFLAYGKQDRQPGEIVTGVAFAMPSGDNFRCYKVSKRFDDDIAAVCGGFNIVREAGRVVSARIAFGGMAATPKRARAVEAALAGQLWSEAALAPALAEFTTDFQPISDLRASAAYRMAVAKNLLQRYFVESVRLATPTRLVGPAAAFGA